MLGETIRVGCALLCLNREEIHRSCLSIEIDEYQLLTPHGQDIPVLFRTLDELLIDEHKGFISKKADWGRILRFPGKNTDIVQFTAGPVTIFVPLEKATQIYNDLNDIFFKAGLQPEVFTPKAPNSRRTDGIDETPKRFIVEFRPIV